MRRMTRKWWFANFMDWSQWIQMSYLLCLVELVHLLLLVVKTINLFLDHHHHHHHHELIIWDYVQVRIYTGDGVAVELEKAKLDYLQASIVVSGTKRIAFPELLLQNMLDFAADRDSFVEWACQQLPTSGSLRKAMVDCFRGHNPGTRISTVLDNIPYDFEFQYLFAI